MHWHFDMSDSRHTAAYAFFSFISAKRHVLDWLASSRGLSRERLRLNAARSRDRVIVAELVAARFQLAVTVTRTRRGFITALQHF